MVILAGCWLAWLAIAVCLWTVWQRFQMGVVDATQAANASLTQAFINGNRGDLAPLLSTGAEPRPPSVVERVAARVRLFSAGTDILKVKIFNAHGMVVYSSDPAEIGTLHEGNAYFRAAMEGKAQSQLTYRGRFDAFEGHVLDRDLISSYIPVRIEGKPLGVVEVYADRTPAIASAREAMRVVAAIIVPVLLLAFGVGMALLVRDIRQRARREEELAELVQRAESASDAKTWFLAHMSHELRTPLNAILGYAQLLQLEAARSPRHGPALLGAEVTEHAGRIGSAGWHLLSMIDDLLDLGKIESGVIDVVRIPVNVGPILEECCQQLRGAAGERFVRIEEPVVAEGAAWVEGDPRRLRQVFLNLISNAVKYNIPRGLVSVAASRSGRSVSLVVSDTGMGMAAEELPKLFQPFTRLGGGHEGIEGSGLGLALTKRLVELMGGTIRAESREGLGTRLIVELAASEVPSRDGRMDEAAPDGEVPGGREPAGRLPRRVLYIEDTPASFELVRAYLIRHVGAEVLRAADGETGVALAIREQPDVILLDMNLPDMDGREVKARLDRDVRTSGIPVLALSADAFQDRIQAALAAGFRGYLTKPLRFPELLEALAGLAAPESDADDRAPRDSVGNS